MRLPHSHSSSSPLPPPAKPSRPASALRSPARTTHSPDGSAQTPSPFHQSSGPAPSPHRSSQSFHAAPASTDRSPDPHPRPSAAAASIPSRHTAGRSPSTFRFPAHPDTSAAQTAPLPALRTVDPSESPTIPLDSSRRSL